jgi:hypothetical protein
MKASLIIPSTVGVFAIIGGLYAFDLNYTRASTTSELKATLCDKDQELLDKIAGQHKRVDQYIAQDRYNWLEERSYKLQDRYEKEPMPLSVKEEYRKIQSEMKRIDEKLDK